MAAASTIVAAGALALSVGSGIASFAKDRQSRRAQRRAEKEQEEIRNEQLAANAGSAAAERRQQIREERIRRAQIIQSASNTGTSGSSGEAGALGSLSSQQAQNLGMNQGAYMRGQRINMHSQNAQDFMGQARTASGIGQMFGGISNMSMSIFNAAGGWGSARNISRNNPTSISQVRPIVGTPALGSFNGLSRI